MLRRSPLWLIIGTVIGVVTSLGLGNLASSVRGVAHSAIDGVLGVVGVGFVDVGGLVLSFVAVSVLLVVVFELSLLAWGSRLAGAFVLFLGGALFWLGGAGAGGWLVVVFISVLVLMLPFGLARPVGWFWVGTLAGAWVVVVCSGMPELVRAGKLVGEVFSYPSGIWAVCVGLAGLAPLAWIVHRARQVSR